MPKDLPPRSTISSYFLRWQHDHTLGRPHHALYVQCREQAGREPTPTVAIVDSQSVKSAETGGLSDPNGYDAGKKIKGRKRHVLVDTQGLLMQAVVHAADVQDRDGGVLLMGSLFGLFPFLLKLYADGGYQGPKFRHGLSRVCRQVNVEIVKRSDAGRFVILPKRLTFAERLADVAPLSGRRTIQLRDLRRQLGLARRRSRCPPGNTHRRADEPGHAAPPDDCRQGDRAVRPAAGSGCR